MRLPKKVLLSGKQYKVLRNPKRTEGWGRGNTAKRIIAIGSKNRDFQAAFECYVHEITELAMLENNLRFNRDSNDEFFYRVNHCELDRLTSDIAIALLPMITKVARKRK